ncbi:MAG: CDP-glucose 4,6-dehydratase [Deltaproteobacteria bacterium]|nr:CDP-glucose 4,6-dehydratase [Deltaproteobacteria bacterium]
MAINPSFWKGRRVLVTGHTGFKGSWLVLWLSDMGADVTGYALAPPTAPSLYETAEAGVGVESVEADIRDLDALARAFADARPEVVFHLAAQSLVRPSYDDPLETFTVNVMGTANLLDAARAAGGVSALVSVTSDKCYENREWLWPYRENEPLGGHDPYSASKACAEIVTASFRRSFFGDPTAPSVATARAGNVIGGGDWAKDRLMTDLLTAFSTGKCSEIRNPSAIRPWQHVLEPLSGYLMLAEKLAEKGRDYAEAWNFGPEASEAATVGAVADMAAALWGDGASWSHDQGFHAHEAHLLKLDATKARIRLGWKPRMDLKEALSLTVKWHKALLSGQDMRKFTLGQIRNYMA